ncbi:hypothetical protein Pan258_57310 [Symmachiella dynata]|nr:hypothetical protein Pan258_57310 [Symmachiella dynata]
MKSEGRFQKLLGRSAPLAKPSRSHPLSDLFRHDSPRRAPSTAPSCGIISLMSKVLVLFLIVGLAKPPAMIVPVLEDETVRVLDLAPLKG